MGWGWEGVSGWVGGGFARPRCHRTPEQKNTLSERERGYFVLAQVAGALKEGLDMPIDKVAGCEEVSELPAILH